MQIFETTLDSLRNAARKIMRETENRHIVALYGKMGSGKTTLVKAICKEIGVLENVTSPTFSLVNEYTSRDNGKIYHFDFYRIKNISEVYDFGYEEYFYSDSICFIEWPEMIEELLPENVMRIYISTIDCNTRELKIDGGIIKNL